MGRLARTPEHVARVIESAISARRPKARYRVGLGAALMLTARKVSPDRVFDLVLRSQFAPAQADAQDGLSGR